MTRSFGPCVVIDATTHKMQSINCHWCIFRSARDGGDACTHTGTNKPRPIPDADATPDWCDMKAGAIRDAEDMASGVTHHVMRWSGRNADEPREIYAGIPSEAARQFRLASRKARRGTVHLEDHAGNALARWPEPELAQGEQS